MTDLPTFLLARIAEDEAIIQAQIVRPRPQLPHEPPRPSLSWWPKCLADCQAKRRIVDAWLAGADGPLGRWDDYAAYAMELAMRYVAMPYADHPDYRQEWKP